MIPLKLAAKFRKFDSGKEIRIRSQNHAVAAGLGMADMISISNVEILRSPSMGGVSYRRLRAAFGRELYSKG